MRNVITKSKRHTVILLCVFLLSALILPVNVQAQEERKVVKVGWYESSFNITDESGRKSGYAYEYQLKIAAYSGWSYEYVTGSWSDLLQMLINGEIDILSDVSYTEERDEMMLFPELPMGTEEYYIFIAPGNTSISANDFSTLKGKKIGVNKGSVQSGLYYKWAQRHNVDAELIEVTCEESESIDMLHSGELDAYITPNVHIDPSRLVPLCKIGYSEFFLAVNKDRPDLLEELNAAMSRIQDENPYYNQRMFEKHVQTFGANAFLSAEEEAWVNNHGTIRVGYQDNYLAFCAKDPDTGELIGALKDYLDNAGKCFTGSHIDYEAVSYPTSEAAFAAMANGEVDCVFPVNLDSYDGETRNVLITPSLIRTDMYAVVRSADQKIFNGKEHVIVAVNKGNPNYDSFLIENFPNWRAVYFETTADCLNAVAEGIADCVIISSYRYNNISSLCDKYHLATYSLGIALDYCFAVPETETELYSIMAKTIGLVPASTVNAALSYYVAQDSKMTFGDIISENIGPVSAFIAAALFLIIFFLIRSLRSERKSKKLIRLTENDELTGLYNRNYFFEYADRIYHEQPGIARDAIVINIERFHSINALNGREFGDSVLRILGKEMSVIAQENDGIAGRFGADRFDIYCKHPGDYRKIFDRLQNKLSELENNVSIRIRMGVMPWEQELEPVQLFDRARTACNMARGHYNDPIIVFDEKVHEKEIFDQRILNDLRRALDNFEFEVCYQPKYDIEGNEPKLVGAEALVRWRHPEFGLLSPDKFVPLFERNGRITELDRYVWEQAARQVSRWAAEFGITIPVSVNLSRLDIYDPALEETFDRIIRDNGLAKSSIELEVTESAYTENPNQVIQVIRRLREKGYTVEMDDFGTGYSSLNMLSEMPVDVLKMDRYFVRNIENSEKEEQLVSLILGIADKLHIPVVAEGVETEAQILKLKELGCTLVQGFYFSRPLHPDDFESELLMKMNGNENITPETAVRGE